MKIKVGVLILLIAVLGSLIYWYMHFRGTSLLGEKQYSAEKPVESVLRERGPLELATQKAKLWHEDAAVTYLESDDINQRGAGDNWHFIFVSEAAPGKGYEVAATNGVVDGKEIEYNTNKTEALPTNVISQAEAIDRVRAMPAYKNASIVGVEAVHLKGSPVWYWGVKTSLGTVSVEATK